MSNDQDYCDECSGGLPDDIFTYNSYMFCSYECMQKMQVKHGLAIVKVAKRTDKLSTLVQELIDYNFEAEITDVENEYYLEIKKSKEGGNEFDLSTLDGYNRLLEDTPEASKHIMYTILQLQELIRK